MHEIQSIFPPKRMLVGDISQSITAVPDRLSMRANQMILLFPRRVCSTATPSLCLLSAFSASVFSVWIRKLLSRSAAATRAVELQFLVRHIPIKMINLDFQVVYPAGSHRMIGIRNSVPWEGRGCSRLLEVAYGICLREPAGWQVSKLPRFGCHVVRCPMVDLEPSHSRWRGAKLLAQCAHCGNWHV
jgi:hypothetical protein